MPTIGRIIASALLSCAASLVVPQVAHADITRGCRATIGYTTATTGRRALVEVDASGTCDNRRDADTCRQRARSEIRICAQTLWDTRAQHAVPSACTTFGTTGGNARINWFRWQTFGVDHLPGGSDSFVDNMRYQVCCTPANSDRHEAYIWYDPAGDSGCRQPGFEDVTTYGVGFDYPIDCNRQRLRGICGSVPQRTNPSSPSRTSGE